MPGSGAFYPARVVAVAFLSLLIGAQVIRSAAVADRQRHPSLAAMLWPGHPAMLTERSYLEVAGAAAKGREVGEPALADLRRLARRAPLSPDPFLIQAAIAETKGKSAAAEKLLVAARDRDPRSRGTRYLLADRYLRTWRVPEGLNEIRVLVGLHGKGGEAFLPMLATYAKTPGSVENLKPFFRKYPMLEQGVLGQLASDVANADLVLSLANPGVSNPRWLGLYAGTLAANGQFAKAYAAWAALGGAGRGKSGLFNPGFASSEAPPPFNWAYTQTPEGVAEPDGKGGLDVLYYGRADAPLALQLLILDPGNYRLSHGVAESSGDASELHWRLRCARPEKTLTDMPLRTAPTNIDFTVPAGCGAVWLELWGKAGDTPQTTGLTIRGMRLSGMGQ